MSSYFNQIVCLECGHAMPPELMASKCAKCGSPWLDARYDYDAVRALWPAALKGRDRSLWRYAELLPIGEPEADITMGEGYTSLTRLHSYERLYRHEHIYAKDERQGPTSSFKDRQAALSVMAMRRAGITECVLASTGNAGAAYAAYCARAGIKLWLFLTSLVPSEKMREAALYGAEVVKVSGTYDETKHVAAEFAKRKGIHFDGGAKAVPGKESMKTLAFEIAEQLATRVGPGDGTPWRSPDWYIQAVSGGIGPLGVQKGFSELHRMGLIDRMPKLGVIQAAGCAPMVRAFEAGRAKADPVVPKTLITVLATGDPGHSYVLLREAILRDGGAMLSIEDGQTFDAMRRLASKAGFSVEPATAVAFAGLERMLAEGIIKPHETVVINCSGHTFTAESHILGDQYVLDLKLNEGEGTAERAQEEGLDAAIRILDEQVTSILVVDDNPTDRRLIRRLLQRYKRYRIYEAASGAEALQVVNDRLPDFIITDLTMPEMDGFTLLERLRHNPATAHIPVVVVSAKTLTEDDTQMLQEYSEAVWTKGGFDTRQLVDYVVRTLGHEPEDLPAPRAKSTIPAEEPPAPGATILIIEDNHEDARLERRLLDSQGSYRVLVEKNGRDGLKAAYEHRPELIILDLMLPEMDGFTILNKLQADQHLRDIPVVVVSAKEMTAEEQARLCGVAALITKSSFDRNLFLSTIDNILK
jgi:threonine synthase